MEKERVDLGHPWGRVNVPPGYTIREVRAACDGSDHSNHPGCDPYWEKNLPEGAILLTSPVLVEEWVALIAVPASH